jgi:hypothetical protein
MGNNFLKGLCNEITGTLETSNGSVAVDDLTSLDMLLVATHRTYKVYNFFNFLKDLFVVIMFPNFRSHFSIFSFGKHLFEQFSASGMNFPLFLTLKKFDLSSCEHPE